MIEEGGKNETETDKDEEIGGETETKKDRADGTEGERD